MSTGGDSGSPGFAIYKRGDHIGAVVSTGEKIWEVEVKGAIPLANEWTNFAIIWEDIHFKNQMEYIDKVIKWENLGGLRVYKNLQLIGRALIPKNCSHSSLCSTATSNFFDPIKIMIGCHATKSEPKFRNFPTTQIMYDEPAIWTYPIDEKKDIQFLWGGYTQNSKSTSDNIRLQLLKKVDPSDTRQVEDAIMLLSSIAGSSEGNDQIVPFANIDDTIKETTTTTTTTTTLSSTKTTSTSAPQKELERNETTATDHGPKKAAIREVDKLLVTLSQLDRLMDRTTLPKYIDSMDLDVRLGIASTTMDVLGEKGVFESSWKALYANSTDAGSHLRREDMEKYLIKLMELTPIHEIPRLKRETFSQSLIDLENILSYKLPTLQETLAKLGSRYFGKLIPSTLKFKSSKNGAVQLIKVQNLILEKKGTSEGGYFVFPHWGMKFWRNINDSWKSEAPLDDQIQIPTKLYSMACSKPGYFSNIMSTIYNNFADGGRRNPTAFPSRKILLMSRIVSVKVTVTNEDISQPSIPCSPLDQFLIRKPLIISLRYLTDFVPRIYRTRTLEFDSDMMESGIKKVHCAIWNPNLGLHGGWDTVGISKVRDEDDMTTCMSHKFGTFTIIGELHDIPTLPQKRNWLQITKFVLHGVSIFCLICFIAVVTKSSQLWDMLFFLSLSLAIALIGAHSTMILSEFDQIRDARHLCTIVGICISFFYLSGGFILLSLSHSLFKAVVYGITRGRARIYLSFSWGTSFLILGLNTFFNINQMGTDPRCMISWNTGPKLYFFIPLLLSLWISIVLIWIVVCNIITPAIRSEGHLGQIISLLLGLIIFTLFFGFTWTLAPFVYNIPLFDNDTLDLNTPFQICNALIGVVFFICLGIFSKKFRKNMCIQKNHLKFKKSRSTSQITSIQDISKLDEPQ
ncbi:uncharacterized protein [Lepeophtheirus salmonis]|uniref:uncharacterized protein n=1 Tax=Lepeophtheirus salmonis TaxID=72036 RepID=UPI003AF3B280